MNKNMTENKKNSDKNLGSTDEVNGEHIEGSEGSGSLNELYPRYGVKQVNFNDLEKEVADAIRLLEKNEILWVEPDGSMHIQIIDKKLPN